MNIPPCLEGIQGLCEFAPPPDPVIYFLIDEDKVVYVGKTTNLGQRIGTHQTEPHWHDKTKKQFDRVVYFRCEIDKLDEMELHWIFKLKTPHNHNWKPRREYQKNVPRRREFPEWVHDAYRRVQAEFTPLKWPPTLVMNLIEAGFDSLEKVLRAEDDQLLSIRNFGEHKLTQVHSFKSEPTYV